MTKRIMTILTLASVMANAQFTLDLCPSNVECLEAPSSFSEIIPLQTGSDSEVMSCDGNSFSQLNYLFEANFEAVLITAEWGLDEDLKMGVVSSCGFFNDCLASVSCSGSGFMELIVENLEVGRAYVFYIDGCNHSQEVPVEITIEPLSVTEIFDAIVDLSVYQNCEENQFPLCTGEPIFIDLHTEDLEYWNGRQGVWQFLYNGPEGGEFFTEDILNNSFFTVEPGQYTLCFESVTFDCFPLYASACVSFEVTEPDQSLVEFDVCQHDLSTGLWVPNENWEGLPITGSGEYYNELDLCDCNALRNIIVNEIPETETEVRIELCPQDYPFEFLGEEEFDYSPFDIEAVINVYEGSLIEDYEGDPCDSIVYLILINEEPQNRCSSCNLPLSLDKGKIVVCLPFDNGTIDVSGRNTIVHAVGVDYDDNGSIENDFWEALFDGNQDYVEIPHIADLNTSVFSINFQFNKDERFENGGIETLVSKGDATNNLRYAVNLEKVNESIFNLKGRFSSDSLTYDLGLNNLQNNTWYDIAYVIENDSLSLYLNGFLEKQIPINESLKGNENDLYIATQISNGKRGQFFNGRLDNFKYWKQKLSGQDVLFLHFPGKEFEITQSYFLSCCEETIIENIAISRNNPVDSIIIPRASPNGYDSTYIYNYIQNDKAPEIDMSLVPQDIVVSFQRQCDEFCSSNVSWGDPSNNIFSDNCNELTITQSHVSPLTLDENMSFVEVVYTATDVCGQSSSFRFGLELQCVDSEVNPIPEQNIFTVLVDEVCVDASINSICNNAEILIQPGFLIEGISEIHMYDGADDYELIVSINGLAHSYNWPDVQNGILLSELNEEGIYEVCLESISNSCQTKSVSYCEIIQIRSTREIDYGTIRACGNNFEDVLPEEISKELRTLILSNPVETRLQLNNEDECGCIEQEKIKLEFASPIEPTEVFIELCPGDYPFQILGVEIFENENHNGTNLSLINGSMATNSNGITCDSTILLTILKKENSLGLVSIDMCEGEIFENYSTSGTYTDKLIAANGCDSTRILELIVLPKSFQDVIVEICPDSTYLGYSAEGVYEVLGTNIHGCDSLTTINLTFLDEMDPACFISSVNEENLRSLSIFPNPVTNTLNLSNEVDAFFHFEIYTISGQLINKGLSLGSSIDVSQIDNGVYFLKAKNKIGYNHVLKFVKI